MPERVIECSLSAEEMYDAIDDTITALLTKAGVQDIDAEMMHLISILNRQIRIALRLPVQVAN